MTSAPVAYLVEYLTTFDGRNYDAMFAASNAISPDAFTATDLEAVTKLKVYPSAEFRQWLLSPTGQAETCALLARIPDNVDLSAVPSSGFAALLGSNRTSPVSELWNLLVEQLKAHRPGRAVQVIASKLIAGKRPKLVPITDSYVRAELGIKSWQTVWTCSHAIAITPGIGSLVASLRNRVAAELGSSGGPLPDGVNPAGLSDLRIFDLAVWCFHEHRVR